MTGNKHPRKRDSEMGVSAITAAWEKSQAAGGELLVLLALADQADDEGVCWPSVITLAGKSRLKKRQVIRVLESLTKRGDVEVWKYRIDGKGPERNVYRLVLGDFGCYKGLAPWGIEDSRKQLVGRQITPDLRTQVFETYGYRCLSCGSTDKLHVDHVVPWSEGGPCELENLQPLCSPCNYRKGTKTIDFRGCQNDTDRENAWNQVSPGTPVLVSPEAPLANAVPCLNHQLESGETNVSPVIDDLKPPKLRKVEGKNLPFDALALACNIAYPDRGMSQTLVTALNGRKQPRRMGIREQFWLECVDWAAGDPAALAKARENFERWLASRIPRRAGLWKAKMGDAVLAPVGLATHWSELETMPDRAKPKPVMEGLTVVDLDDGFDTNGVADMMAKLIRDASGEGL